MKLLKSKKGLDYAILFMIVTLICLGFLIWQLNQKDESFTKDIGSAQIGLINTQEKADNLLFYLDQSAKYSAYEVADILSQRGGFADASASCGSVVDGFVSWNTCKAYSSICFPDVFTNFKSVFSDQLNDIYLEQYNSGSFGMKFIKDNYVFAIHDKKITGTAVQNIESNIQPFQSNEGEYSAGRFAFKPSFSIDFPYDFNHYFELNKLANAVVSDCANKFTSFVDVKACAESNFEDWQNKPIIKKTNKSQYIAIEYPVPGFNSLYSGKTYQIRFALCVPWSAPAV